MARKMLALLLGAVLLAGCSAGETRFQSVVWDLFDTVTVITGYAADEDAFAETADAICAELELCHRLFDIYTDYEGLNNIRTVNEQAGIAPVQVDGRILDLLEQSIALYQTTGGKCNVAMGAVLRLWHDAREQGDVLPDSQALDRAAQHMDIADIHIDRQAGTVYLADPEMSLDVGAIAKGYAAERVRQLLIAQGKTGWLVSIGGNVVSVGAKPDGSLWQVGIENPSGADATIDAVAVADVAVVTSGSYQRYFELDGVRYHHIIDPDTLQPENRYLSVSVLALDSVQADALSTALFNMPEADALALVEELEGVEALFVRADGTVFASAGWAKWQQ